MGETHLKGGFPPFEGGNLPFKWIEGGICSEKSSFFTAYPPPLLFC